MAPWQKALAASIKNPLEFEGCIPENQDGLAEVNEIYPMRITPYFQDLITPGGPLWKQVVPDIRELKDTEGLDDPLLEEEDAPVSALTHRYPDRVLLVVTLQCGGYCRFCTRKRKVGEERHLSSEEIGEALNYIAAHPEIRDVIVSGGDPLTLTDSHLEDILQRIRAIEHVDIIRVHSRMPCFLPERITPELVEMLKTYHPLFFNVHFNHPRELTPQARAACERLAEGGIPLGSQTVLLKGINDQPEIMCRLFRGLLQMRVRPYHLYQADLARGTNHFRTTVQKGLEIIKALQGHISGLAVPAYVVDTPGGGGKVILQPENVLKMDEQELVVSNYEGKTFHYPNPAQKDE